METKTKIKTDFKWISVPNKDKKGLFTIRAVNPLSKTEVHSFSEIFKILASKVNK